MYMLLQEKLKVRKIGCPRGDQHWVLGQTPYSACGRPEEAPYPWPLMALGQYDVDNPTTKYFGNMPFNVLPVVWDWIGDYPCCGIVPHTHFIWWLILINQMWQKVPREGDVFPDLDFDSIVDDKL